MELNVIKRVIAIAAVALTTSAAKAQGYAEPVYTNPNGSELTAKCRCSQACLEVQTRRSPALPTATPN